VDSQQSVVKSAGDSANQHIQFLSLRSKPLEFVVSFQALQRLSQGGSARKPASPPKDQFVFIREIRGLLFRFWLIANC
jgi:hypothetical protein